MAADEPGVVLVMSEHFQRIQFTPAHMARLRAMCHVADDRAISDLTDPRLDHLLASADILVTGWGCPPLDVEVLAAAPHVKLIAHAAGTVKAHITDACWERGIAVSSAAAANAVPVAEYTIAAILLANKGALFLDRPGHTGRPRMAATPLPTPGNYRKTVGLVGASHVGRRVAALLQPFDLSVVISDPYLSADEAERLGGVLVDLDALLRTADVVSLHAPALPETRHLIGGRELALMRDGAVLLNTARGSLVDHDALLEELGSGRLFAVLDTVEPEPLPLDSPLHGLANAFLTPHIAGSMGAETHRLTELALDEVQRFVCGQPLAHEVHRDDIARIA